MEQLHPYAIWILIAFIIGYTAITLEHLIKINKATSALLMAIVTWTFLFLSQICQEKNNLQCFLEQFGDISQIIFFLLGALTIVEVISIHHGFNVISDFIQVSSKRKLLWVIGFVTFFLSSVLDNLTTTIVMVTLLHKLLPRGEDRLIIGGGVVIAANAGGAWTPIGDVTTTMLWIGGQLTAPIIIRDLFLPSIICMVISFLILTPMLKGSRPDQMMLTKQAIRPFGKTILVMGIGALIFVPIFKVLTGLPPFMGVLLGVAALWIFTDIVHTPFPDRNYLRVPAALSKIDLPSTLFFLGILMCVDALNMANLLERLAHWLDTSIGNVPLIATLIGIISAIIDNVPLVAASMRMYDLSQHPVDSQFWELIAFCAGTGGSILVIGSAAGVVYMGLEKVDFFWYLKKISFAALVGYLAGIGVYLLL